MKSDAEKFKLGHRKRLLEKLHNNQMITQTELLEILLFFVIKRRDTKPIAKALLNKFKSVMGVCDASVEMLKSIDGIGDSTVDLIKTFYKLSKSLMFSSVITKDVMENFDQLIKYCQFKLAHKTQEELHVIYLNSKYQIIHIDEQKNGDTTHIDIMPKKIVHQGLNYGAFSIILIHNHPSGDPTPSSADIDATLYLKKLLNELNISLFDHVIVAGSAFFSFKKQKLIN